MTESHVRFGTVVDIRQEGEPDEEDDDGYGSLKPPGSGGSDGMSDVTLSIRDGDFPPPPPRTYQSPPPPGLNTPLTGIRKMSNGSFSSKELRRKLTREHSDRDPLFYYEVLQVLGVGSMGSVAKVRKRSTVIGGSARSNLQKHFRKEKRLKSCFNLPLVGGLFQTCMEGAMQLKNTNNNDYDSERSRTSSILQPASSVSLPTPDEEAAGYIYAMKSIHLSRVTDPTFVEELKNEVAILRDLDHPHIVKAIETFEHRKQLFMVMELCSGGDLYARDPYSEEDAARIISSILSAISYMHSRDFCHRDLKYENVLFVNGSAKAEIKLIDFGLSKAFGEDKLTEGVGTM